MNLLCEGVLLVAALLTAAPDAAAGAQSRASPSLRSEDLARARPIAPFRIADNLFYVGTSDIAVYLFADAKGLILLDAGYEQSAPLLLANIRQLGFDPKRIRILIASQAHSDHAGGLAAIKAATGATLYASPADAAALERGGHGDFAFGDRLVFPAITPDRLLHDGETIRLGALRLTAHFTPGHTRGCTSWTMTATDAGRKVPALFVCGASAPGYRLVGNAAYPEILQDFGRAFATWRRLPCELFLGAHGSYFGLAEKRAALASARSNPFVDPTGCRVFLEEAEAAIKAEADRQAKGR